MCISVEHEHAVKIGSVSNMAVLPLKSLWIQLIYFLKKKKVLSNIFSVYYVMAKHFSLGVEIVNRDVIDSLNFVTFLHFYFVTYIYFTVLDFCGTVCISLNFLQNRTNKGNSDCPA